jgi:hypothetical protein
MILTEMSIAEAICRENPRTGTPHAYKGAPLSLEQRAKNIIALGYVSLGDPYGWSRGAAGTILMEPKGGRHDCPVPLDYYGDGLEVSLRAAEHMDPYYIEFVNTAVACVYHV